MSKEETLSHEFSQKTYTISKHLAMRHNYYKARYEVYKEALKEIIDVSPDEFAIRISRDALKLEVSKYESDDCEYCENLREEFIYCPICGKARRKV